MDLIQLIWDNCKEYNKEGHFFELAERMEKHFKKMIKNYLPSVVYTVVQQSNFLLMTLEVYPVQSTYKRQAPKEIIGTTSRTSQQKSYIKQAVHERPSSFVQP